MTKWSPDWVNCSLNGITFERVEKEKEGIGRLPGSITPQTTQTHRTAGHSTLHSSRSGQHFVGSEKLDPLQASRSQDLISEVSTMARRRFVVHTWLLPQALLRLWCIPVASGIRHFLSIHAISTSL